MRAFTLCQMCVILHTVLERYGCVRVCVCVVGLGKWKHKWKLFTETVHVTTFYLFFKNVFFI